MAKPTGAAVGGHVVAVAAVTAAAAAVVSIAPATALAPAIADQQLVDQDAGTYESGQPLLVT